MQRQTIKTTVRLQSTYRVLDTHQHQGTDSYELRHRDQYECALDDASLLDDDSTAKAYIVVQFQ